MTLQWCIHNPHRVNRNFEIKIKRSTGLISFACEYAKKSDCYKMYLITNKSNISACKCYEKAGGINKADDEVIYVYDFRNNNCVYGV